jgi:ATP-binding cassette subfamily B protein
MIGFVQSWQNAKISMERLNEVHQMEDEEPAGKHLLKELPPALTMQIAGGKNSYDLPEAESLQYYKSKGNEDFVHYENIQSINEFSTGGVYVNDNPSLWEGGVSFNNVSFTYAGAGNEPVLSHINLNIPVGKTTAIVGVSGSGKTTLLKLLLKFYEPQIGEIKLGKVSLSNVSHNIWRSHCGVVMQESFIFSDSIAQNIAVGQEKIDMDRLRHAVRVANAEEFIAGLPLGFNTKIGAEGNGISMGQKQRLLIARAVYRNPSFIFFDEATNSLDANNESVILSNLEKFFKGRTVVIVAHRLSTVKSAEQIVVLNKGRITERGTHQELISLKGEYFTLVKNQLELGD